MRDLSDIWPILLKLYGLLFLIVLVLVICLWVIDRTQQKIHPDRLSSAVLTELMEELVEDHFEEVSSESSDEWLLKWYNKEFYREF